MVEPPDWYCKYATLTQSTVPCEKELHEKIVMEPLGFCGSDGT